MGKVSKRQQPDHVDVSIEYLGRQMVLITDYQ